MQKALLTILFLFTAIQISAQDSPVQILNHSSLYPERPVLFAGIQNRLQVTGIDPRYQVLLTSKKGAVSFPERHGFLVSDVERPTDTLTVIKDGIIIMTRVYAVEEIPDAVARLGNRIDTILTVGEILADPFVRIVLPGSVYRHTYTVFKFEMTISFESEPLYYFSNYSNQLSDEQKRIIRGLKKGAILSFSEIVAGGPDSRQRKMVPFSVVVR